MIRKLVDEGAIGKVASGTAHILSPGMEHWHPNPDFFAYTLSKATLGTATMLLAQAYAPRLRVNAIAPGITLPSADQTQAEFHAAQRLAPLGYGATPEDLVAALRFLIAAEATTGQTIHVDGGQSLRAEPRDVMYTVRGD